MLCMLLLAAVQAHFRLLDTNWTSGPSCCGLLWHLHRSEGMEMEESR